MKTIQRMALAAIFMLAAQGLSAQSKKVDSALDGFKNTSFMLQFLDLRTQMETAARAFKTKLNSGGEHPMDPQEAQTVMAGYEKSASRANAILRGIVSDFLEPKKLRFIAQYPDTYAKGLELDMRMLSDFQVQHFMQPLNDLCADEVDGAPVLLVIVQLVMLTSELTNYLSEVKARKRQFTADYLEQNLYEACRFRYWDELDNGWQSSDPNRRTKVDPLPLPSLPPLDTRFDSSWEWPGAAPGGNN